MDRVAKTAKARTSIRQPAALQWRAPGVTGVRSVVEQRLTDALAQQAATDDILRLMAASPTDIRPVLQGVAQHAAQLCRAPFARVHRIFSFRRFRGLMPRASCALHTAATPIIAITSFAMNGDDQKAKEAGATAYLAKPYSPFDLLSLIRTLVPEA